MPQFCFPLQRVLEVRRKQLEAEETRLRARASALNSVELERAQLAGSASAAEQDVRARGSIAGFDLEALAAFQLHVRAQEAALAARRIECERAVAQQQA